jgi:GNAT superfamily N-acetyltransferase
MRRNIAKCYVVIDESTNAITAFYTLAATGFPLEELPPALIKTLPRYPVVPAVRIGRLAVDQRFQGQKLGAALIADAIVRVRDAAPAAFAILVDAKHEQASAFYQHHGFVPFDNSPRTLFLPLETALRAMRS